MKEMVVTGIVTLLLTISFDGYSLNENSDWFCLEEKGKYQIEVLVRAKVLYPSDLCRQIKDNRQQNEQVVISLGDFIRVRILSLNEISSGIRYAREVIYVKE